MFICALPVRKRIALVSERRGFSLSHYSPVSELPVANTSLPIRFQKLGVNAGQTEIASTYANRLALRNRCTT